MLPARRVSTMSRRLEAYRTHSVLDGDANESVVIGVHEGSEVLSTTSCPVATWIAISIDGWFHMVSEPTSMDPDVYW